MSWEAYALRYGRHERTAQSSFLMPVDDRRRIAARGLGIGIARLLRSRIGIALRDKAGEFGKRVFRFTRRAASRCTKIAQTVVIRSATLCSIGHLLPQEPRSASSETRTECGQCG